MSTSNQQSTGTLFVVATPIGNLEDITERAKRVLAEADLVLAEDTRQTKKLLSHFDINAHTESFHAHSGNQKIDAAIKRLQEGEKLALVSDAGTPTISDPGYRLVKAAREQTTADIIAIPGPSSVTTALSTSGLPANDFLFLGFLPKKKGRNRLFSEIQASFRTVVFFESPYRLEATLEELAGLLEGNRDVVVAKELSKIHEQVVSGSATEVKEYFSSNADRIRGEFIVMVAGRSQL